MITKVDLFVGIGETLPIVIMFASVAITAPSIILRLLGNAIMETATAYNGEETMIHRDNLLNEAQKQVFIEAIIKGQLANPPDEKR